MSKLPIIQKTYDLIKWYIPLPTANTEIGVLLGIKRNAQPFRKNSDF